jgi:hypothetical protein
MNETKNDKMKAKYPTISEINRKRFEFFNSLLTSFSSVMPILDGDFNPDNIEKGLSHT